MSAKETLLMSTGAIAELQGWLPLLSREPRPHSKHHHAYLVSNAERWRAARNARRPQAFPRFPAPPASKTHRLSKLCRIRVMGAGTEHLELRCAVGPSPLASARGISNCSWSLAARLGATPGAWWAQRERVESTLLSTTTAASSLEPRAAVRGPARTESGLCRQHLSPHRPDPL